MTTEQLRAIAEAAIARQADITPAPWVRDTRWYTLGVYADSGDVMVMGANHDEQLEIPNEHDAQLITDAPDLNAAVVELWERLERAQGVDAWEVD